MRCVPPVVFSSPGNPYNIWAIICLALPLCVILVCFVLLWVELHCILLFIILAVLTSVQRRLGSSQDTLTCLRMRISLSVLLPLVSPILSTLLPLRCLFIPCIPLGVSLSRHSCRYRFLLSASLCRRSLGPSSSCCSAFGWALFFLNNQDHICRKFMVMIKTFKPTEKHGLSTIVASTACNDLLRPLWPSSSLVRRLMEG
mmetsp:Transcript_85706/g.138985  ORF Transcript_85706/g.138985 Transcript_85706/m.138985 type:complete len:200 (-) Transcript_85706:563-1162(-)